MKTSTFFYVLAIGGILILTSCQRYLVKSGYNNTNELVHQSSEMEKKPYLKAHLKNGDVCILHDTWLVDSAETTVSGKGERFNFNRKYITVGELIIPVDSVLVFETNAKIKGSETGRIFALTILTAMNVGLTAFCFTNPKACYGSCPTFYQDPNSDFHYSDAEGFSNAICSRMEYSDVDALIVEEQRRENFEITMKNEALETHVVNNVELLVYPVRTGEQVIHSFDDRFLLCNQLTPLKNATAEEGDITPLVVCDDKQERFSLSDENNLVSREEIILEFESAQPIENPLLILDFRQTMMTTYFIYSAMGYMGNEVSDVFAAMEKSDENKEKLEHGLKSQLGGIEIHTWNEDTKEWEYNQEFYETGPIAMNRQCIRLDQRPSNVFKIKIILNKGLWRLDYTALANVIDEVVPTILQPEYIVDKGTPDPEALKAILDPCGHLNSLPGSEYTFHYTMPDATNDYQYFLKSTGYYLEWMREYWLADKNFLKLRQMLYKPENFLKDEASFYKKYEEQIESDFWNSRIDTKTFTYHEK